jgi:hypothetical protein
MHTVHSEFILHDQIGGKGPVYDLSGKTQRVHITVDGGRLRFKLPFDPPSVIRRR